LAIAVGLFFPWAAWIYSANQVTPRESAQTARLFIIPWACQPEPGERLVFQFGLIFFPVALLGLSFAFGRLRSRRWFRVPLVYLGGVELTVAGLLASGGWWCLREQHFFHLARHRFFERPFRTWPIFLASVVLLRLRSGEHRAVKGMVHGLALALVALLAIACVFDENGAYSRTWHFTAAFQSVVQVHQGNALLINCRGQYGLYAHFLQPLFALCGLSVLKFTLVMGLLLATSFVALWAFLREATANHLAAGFGFFALVFAGWLYHRFPGGQAFHCFDPYFQYHPIRFLFPTALVWLGWTYLRRPRRGLYWGALVFLSAGVLWNFDSGLPALLTWITTLCFADLFRPGARAKIGALAGHLGAGGLSGAGVVGLYAAAMFLRYGAFPDFAEFFHFQKLFYLAGFCMLPMEFPGTWVLVVLVYLAGLTYAAFALAANRGTVKANMVFLLSVLGLGLFSYYQGRSHPYVLTLVWWPCFLLMTLFLDELLVTLRAGHGRPLHWFFSAVLVWCLAGFSWSAVREVPLGLRLIGAHLSQTLEPQDAALQQEVARIRSQAAPGAGMVILAPSEALLHLASGVPPVSPCSYIEMILREDHVNLLRYLEQHPGVRIYVEKQLFDHDWPRFGSRWLFDQIQERYERADETPGGYFFRTGSLRTAGRNAAGAPH
jgi:hypothetical protein